MQIACELCGRWLLLCWHCPIQARTDSFRFKCSLRSKLLHMGFYHCVYYLHCVVKDTVIQV